MRREVESELARTDADPPVSPGRGQAARGRETGGTHERYSVPSPRSAMPYDLPKRPPSERAGDGNRTRMTSLEGWDSSH